jgi:hypothetical protein
MYVSNQTIYLGGTPLSLDPNTNELKINNVPVSQTINYEDIPNVPIDVSDLTDTEGLLGGGGGGNPFDQDLNTDDSVTFNSVGATTVNVSQINGTNPGDELVIQANNHNWTFDTNGNITFPQGTLLGYSDPGGFIINGAVDKDIAIYTYNGADAHGWTFGTDGNLTLPAGGDIVDSNGTSVLGGGGNANIGDFVFSDNFLTVSAGDQVVIQGETDGDARIDIPDNNLAENSKALTISNSGAQGVKISTGGNADNIWEFDNRGILRLPEGGDIINSSGQSVLGGGSYTPDDTDNWEDPAVNTVQAALDELAARMTAFENFEIDGGNAYTPAAGELLIDGNGA